MSFRHLPFPRRVLTCIPPFFFSARSYRRWYAFTVQVNSLRSIVFPRSPLNPSFSFRVLQDASSTPTSRTALEPSPSPEPSPSLKRISTKLCSRSTSCVYRCVRWKEGGAPTLCTPGVSLIERRVFSFAQFEHSLTLRASGFGVYRCEPDEARTQQHRVQSERG